MSAEGRLPWRVGEALLAGRYREACDELISWCALMVQEAPFHFIIETMLILFVVALVVTRRKTVAKTIDLDPKARARHEGVFFSDGGAKKRWLTSCARSGSRSR